MSKVDAQRALRDARYARFAAAKKSEAATAKKSPAKAPTAKAAPKGPSATPAAEPVPDELSPPAAEPPSPDPVTTSATAVSGPATDDEPVAEVGEELCGHRSMNGRSCTRSKGHPQKNHRYN
jgi:hypothetical protein